MEHHDAIIIGAGHNGLTCAAYLARRGLRVKVLERAAGGRRRRGHAGIPSGFRNSVAAYTVSLLNPKVIADLDLPAHGLRIVERRAQNFLPGTNGEYLLVADGRTEQEIAKFSARDAERYGAFNREIDQIADVLRDLVLAAAAQRGRGLRPARLGRILRATGVLKRLRGLSMAGRRALLDLFTKSAADYLDGWFEGDLIKALYGFDAVVGNYASPDTPGTAYVMLHHAFGEVNGQKRVWGHAIGGMGAITQAMAKAAAAAGAEIETGAAVRELIIERGGVRGVVLADGRTIRATIVASSVNPRLLYTRLIPADALPAEFRARMERWRCGSGTFRMNVALSSLPQFAVLAGNRRARPSHCRHHHGTEPRLYGPRLSGRPQSGLEPGTDHRDVDPLDARRFTGAARRPCRQPVLPARGAAIAGRIVLGSASRHGRRSDDRDGRSLCAGLCGKRGRSPGAEPARSGT